MKARLFSLGGERHRAVERLLPWYANGTLDAAESAEVDAHLRECTRCQADLRWQQRVQSAEPRDEHVDEEAAAADAGWAKVRAAAVASSPPHERAPRVAPFALPMRPPRWLGWTAIAAPLVALLAVTAVLFVNDIARAPYRALAAAAPSSANALVVFAPQATEAQIRATLREQQAQVVSGPTSTDAWLVEVPRARLDAAIAAWRAQPSVMRAESLEPAAPAASRGTP